MSFISLAVNAGAIWGKVWPILIAILFFGLIIIFHELGHFTFAKLFKVQVNEFSIGMGPAIFKFRKGETKYSLRLLPIGGYVSMEGEDEESDSDRAFLAESLETLYNHCRRRCYQPCYGCYNRCGYACNKR